MDKPSPSGASAALAAAPRDEHRADCAKKRGLAVCVCATPAAAPIGAPDARPDEEMGRLKLIEKEARDLDARLMELWDLLPEGSHEDAPFSSTAVAWWGLHKALGCCTPETPTPFGFPEKQSPPAAASLEVEALDAKLVEIQKLCRNDELEFDLRSGIDRLAADARAVLRRSGR